MPRRAASVEQRIEHRARPIRVRKELAVFFFVQADTQLLEKCRGAFGWKRAQHVAHDARRAAPEIALGDLSIGDVAARAAADQNLGADAACAVETPHAQVRRGAGREDRRRQARCPCADNHDIKIMRRHAIRFGTLGSGSWQFRIPEMADAATRPADSVRRHHRRRHHVLHDGLHRGGQSRASSSTPGTGMPFSGALTATVLIAFSMTLLMGLYARLPFAVAPGMGLNAFFAFTIVLQQQVPWQTALGMVFWAGVLFLIVSATPLRERDRAGDPAGPAPGRGRRHRPAADVHRPAQRRPRSTATRRRCVRLGTLDHRAAFLLARRRSSRRSCCSAGTTRSPSWRRSSR